MLGRFSCPFHGLRIKLLFPLQEFFSQSIEVPFDFVLQMSRGTDCWHSSSGTIPDSNGAVLRLPLRALFMRMP